MVTIDVDARQGDEGETKLVYWLLYVAPLGETPVSQQRLLHQGRRAFCPASNERALARLRCASLLQGTSI